MRHSSAWWTNSRLRLTLLLALLAALVVYALGMTSAATGVGGRAASICPPTDAPRVADVSGLTLQGLREDLRGVMFGRGRRLYERGVVVASDAWSDNGPGRQSSLTSGGRAPGGFELRWWADDGDDIVADAFVFADTSRARAFFDLATRTRCRLSPSARVASSPPGARDLAWTNPDGFAQEDVYLLRGQRVYLVSVVRAGAAPHARVAVTDAAFALVNGLACALPAATCQPHGDAALARLTLAEQLALMRRQLPGGEARTASAAAEARLSACANISGAYDRASGSALSESLDYTDDVGLRLGVHVYPTDALARHALALSATPAARNCVLGRLISALLGRRHRVEAPHESLTAANIGQGALVSELRLPVSHAGHSYTRVFDGVIVRQGRIVDALSTVAPVARTASDEQLAARLAQLAAGEQR